MSSLSLDLLPSRPAVRSDAPMTLDVLLRITPAAPDVPLRRPTLNLGLVLDHSGSMAGHNKIDFARQAAVYAVEQLLPGDRVSITVFDDAVQTIVLSTPATDKGRLIDLIRQVQPNGSTALHAGWTEGARQVGGHRVSGGLNRVLLLTDGLANVGETNPDVIATDVKRQSLEGVGTTTMGVGADYNEDLLEAMAASGDGNYYYIESPRQLPDIFQTELQGLLGTVGHKVRLALEPLSGTTVADVLNDLERDPDGRLQLANLITGMPLEVVVRLNVPAQQYHAGLCRFHLTWQDPHQGEQQQESLLALPAVSGAEWNALAEDAAVRERVALLLIGRLKHQAIRHIRSGNVQEALAALREARRVLAALPRSPLVEQEEGDLLLLERLIEQGDYTATTKAAGYQRYQQAKSRPRTQS